MESNDLLNAWQPCIFHFVDYNGIIDYSYFSVPIILHFLNENAKHRFDSRGSKVKWGRNMGLFKVQNTRCLLTVFAIDSNVLCDLKLGSPCRTRFEKQRNSILHFLQHKYRIGEMECTKVMTYPSYILILSDMDVWKFRHLLVQRRYYTWFFPTSHLPTVFVLSYDNNLDVNQGSSKSSLIVSGWFNCWYCQKPGIAEFTCPQDAVSCCSTMMNTFMNTVGQGLSVAWSFSDESWNLGRLSDAMETFKGLHPYRFQKPNDNATDPYNTLSLAIISFLGESLNHSVTGNNGAFDIPPNPVFLPFVEMKLIRSEMYSQAWIPYTFNTLGVRQEFRFITADSVTSAKSSLRLYFAPFDSVIWTALLCSSVITATVVTMSTVSIEMARCFHSFTSALSKVFTMLIGQSATIRQSASEHRIGIAMLSLWLIVGLIISECYKGNLKCKYIQHDEHFTPWKHLHELQDFDIFFEMDEYQERLPVKTSILEHNREFCDGKPRKSCVIMQSLVEYGLQNNMDPAAIKNKTEQLLRAQDPRLPTFIMLTKMGTNLHFLFLSNITNGIMQNLTRPKTVFVTTKTLLPTRWQTFSKLMRQRKVKFAHNYEVNDGMFRELKNIYMTSGHHPIYQATVPRRCRVLSTSGLYNQWEKWVFRDSENLDWKIQLEKAAPLTLEGSDIQVVFFGFASGACICFMSFILELVYYQIVRVAEQRNYEIRT